MLPDLRVWLEQTGRLRQATHLIYELPWLGRRVDLALINSRGTTTAFELKIGNIQRALEQATYNRSSFDRSWVVTGNYPQRNAIAWAERLGVGILYVRAGETTVVLPALQEKPDPHAARRLRGILREKAKGDRDVAI